MAMSRPAAWLAAIGCFIGMVACLVGLRYHQPERVPALGGFRCKKCGTVADSLDAFGEDGYVSEDRPTYDRDGRTITRDGTRDGTGVG